MYCFLKTKKLLIKVITSVIFSRKTRKNIRNFLYYFSIVDFIRFKLQNFHIVSLGNNCLPRVLTTAVKLKPRKIYGEKTLPFDLKYSYDLEKTAKLIQNNFNDFFEDIELTQELFPHDYKLTKQQFETRYNKRIKNFLKVMTSDKMIYFIYADFDNQINVNTIRKLYYVLKNKRNGKPFKIIVLTAKTINISNPDIYVIVQDFKIKDGTWIKSFINDYGDKKNQYTEFCNITGKKLKHIINYDT